MRRVGVAVEELDQVVRPGHEGVVDALLRQHRAHRHAAVGQALGDRHQVRRHAEGLRREGLAGAAEAGDDLVEDQQDAVPVADLAQALQVALRRDQHARRAGHRLDDHRRDRRRVMQRDQALQVVGQFRAMRRQADAEGIAGDVVGVAQVVDARQQRPEHLAVGDHAAHRHAAEVDAVITALAADEAGALAFAAGAVVGQRDLQRRLHRLRAGVGEEHLVHALGRDAGQPRGEFEGLGMAHLEGGSEVQLRRLFLDRPHDARPVVACVHAPQAGDAVQDLAPLVVGEVHAVRARQQARRLLELPVGGERHPVGVEVGTGGGGHGGAPGAARSARVIDRGSLGKPARNR